MAQLTPNEQQDCLKLLKTSVLLRNCSDSQLQYLASKATKKTYQRGEPICREGTPQNHMYVVTSGEVIREKINEQTGQAHQIDTNLSAYTVGSLHVMNKDPSYATSKAASDVVAYQIPSDVIRAYFEKDQAFAYNVLYSLTMEVRAHTKAQRTPLLEQQSKRTPIWSVSAAASVESFYRSALNALLNQHLTGIPMKSYFPNMHIQLPTRVLYINGFKGLRAYLDSVIHPEQYSNPTAVRLAAAVTPGIVMTPISSLLEATHVGHANPAPIYTRWISGIVPRTFREVIFGVGLNQLSDYCEERVPIQNPALKNAAGSLSAGVISGYLSHVVHNMSTLKLMGPDKSYSTHFREYCKRAEPRVPSFVPAGLKGPATVAIACVFPAGVLIRTSQIVGSFIILNGTINAIARWYNPNVGSSNDKKK